MSLVDPTGKIPIDTIWDVGNVVYDLARQDWTSFTADLAATAIPYVPAGVTKISNGFTKEMLSNAETIAKGNAIRKVDELVEKFGGQAKDWVKKKGWDSCGVEWHWYENKGMKVGKKQAGEHDPF